MSEEPRHSDVDDVDIDEGVKKAVHDGPLKADELGEPGSGRQGKDGPASGSTVTGTNSPDE